MIELDQRLTKLERRFHYMLVGAVLTLGAVAIYGGRAIHAIPQHAADTAINYVKSEDFNLILQGQLAQQTEEIVFLTGTIRPDDWKLLKSGGMYGIEADVLIERETLQKLHQHKIYLSRRGEGMIWETQGLSAYPLEEWYQTEEEWDHGFRVIIHGGTLANNKRILEYAQSHRQWHVDWIVIGTASKAK